MNKNVLIEKLFLVIRQLNDGRLPEDLCDDFIEWIDSKQANTSEKPMTGVMWKSTEDDSMRWSDYTERGIDKMYFDLAKYYAFSDFDQCERPVAAYDNGNAIQYCGWEPNMVIRFKKMFTDEIVYECQHMEWEH